MADVTKQYDQGLITVSEAAEMICRQYKEGIISAAQAAELVSQLYDAGTPAALATALRKLKWRFEEIATEDEVRHINALAESI